MWLGLLVAFIYGAVAVAANFVNKYAVQVLPLPTTILLIQTLTMAVLLRAMAALQFIRVPGLRSVRVHQLAPLAVCYAIHAVLVLYSLAFLSVPMYNTLKRLTPVMVLATKAAMDKRWPDAQTTFSVLLIVGGCLVAGAGDLSFDGQGYSLALLCAFMQAAYILLAEKASGGGGGAGQAPRRKYHSSGVDLPDVEAKSSDNSYSHDHGTAHSTCVGVHGNLHLTANAASTRMPLSTSGPRPSGVNGLTQEHAALGPLASCLGACAPAWNASTDGSGPLSAAELLYSICVISVPALATVSIATGEGARAPALLSTLRAEIGFTHFTAWLCITAVTEGLLTGSVILCTQMNSALTTSIVGVLKGAVSSVLGFFLLGGVKFHVVNVAGITMNMIGGVWYSASQYLRSRGTA